MANRKLRHDMRIISTIIHPANPPVVHLRNPRGRGAVCGKVKEWRRASGADTLHPMCMDCENGALKGFRSGEFQRG
jgi:hypothetical protein